LPQLMQPAIVAPAHFVAALCFVLLHALALRRALSVWCCRSTGH
jgi:hypothetical protein